MCGRYVSPEQASIERAWKIDRASSNPFPRRFNVQPTTAVPMLRLEDGARTLSGARWGLIPHWWKQDKPPSFSINARLEDISRKPMWRDPIRRSRCLVPAEGWYEWQETPSGKQPHYITRRDRRPFCFAGLYAHWRDTLSCAILTTQALGPIAEVHERMPVVLPEDAFGAWLEPAMHDAAVATTMAQAPMAPEDFEHYPVSRRVNNARNEGPDLIEPLRA
ncbi:MAG TPA: SOS response-associated peptidase [Burkholderiales bacterium]|nr:SOS response-associated peptidase [Burkholderiales bacterium]